MAKKLMTVVGARPQFVKAAVISAALTNAREMFEDVWVEEIIHTGQHFDHAMSGVFFQQLGLPDAIIDLGISANHHGQATGRMLMQLEKEMISRQPDAVLVYGDTNSTLAAALASAKLSIPIIHVEAGLRSFVMEMPEEVNRRLTDHISSLLFCPSETSRANLLREGITEGIHVVGDVMYDSVLAAVKTIKSLPTEWGEFALATCHRAETVDRPERLASVLKGIANCLLPVVFPMHPRTQKAIQANGIKIPDNVRAIGPLPYFEMLDLIQKSQFVMTDSGGLQKEAFFLGKRCLTLRDETEWTELVDADVNRLVGISTDTIEKGYDWALAPFPQHPITPYGDGTAGEKIVNTLMKL